MPKAKKIALSTVVAEHRKITPQHARRLIKRNDPRAIKALKAASTPAASAIGKFVMELAELYRRNNQNDDDLDLPNIGRVELMAACRDGTITGKLKREVESAFETLMEAEDVYRRALAKWHTLDQHTAGSGSLREVAEFQKEIDSEREDGK